MPPPLPSRSTGDVLARFADRCGQPVFEALGIHWLRRSRHLYQSLPPQRELELEPEQVDGVLRDRSLLAMQYPTPSSAGAPGGLFVCRTQGYSLARMTKTRRARVRKGQERAELRRMDPDELLALGFALNLETMARQRRFDPVFGEPARWVRFVRAVREFDEVAVYGAFVEGELATYALTCRDGGWLHGLYKMQRTRSLRLNTSCALDAWILCDAARDPTVELLVNGLAQGPEDPLFEYKCSLGFEVLPQRRVTQLHPVARCLARGVLVRAAQALSRSLPRSSGLRALSSVAAAAAYGLQGAAALRTEGGAP